MDRIGMRIKELRVRSLVFIFKSLCKVQGGRVRA